MTYARVIETAYGGYRFRSRLEARWAVFLDALPIPYEYEKEGYDLGEVGWYLPDFWLPFPFLSAYPNAGYWLEVKGQQPSEEEVARARALSKLTKHTTWIAWGLPGEHPFYFTHNCGNEGWHRNMGVLPEWYKVAEFIQWRDVSIEDVENAMVRSKQARFEHGGL